MGAVIVQTAISAIGGMIVIYIFYFLAKKTASWSDNRARNRISALPQSEQAIALREYEERLANTKKREMNWIWLLLFLVFGLPLILTLVL